MDAILATAGSDGHDSSPVTTRLSMSSKSRNDEGVPKASKDPFNLFCAQDSVLWEQIMRKIF
jgi:hypothetical protein